MRFMPRFAFYLCFFASLVTLPVSNSYATSGQFGDTGLISQPKAQTLNEGNICVGLWANCSDGIDTPTTNAGDGSLVIPATITLGLGTFLEVFGSYPNLSFNGDEDSSARGFANAGFKARILGKRSDRFRLALDVQGRLSVSDDPDFDGLTDYVSRLIASFNTERLGFHFNAGYAFNESPDMLDYEDQLLLGGGVEFALATRLRMVTEFSYESERISGQDSPSEVTVGLQYYVTPHLTMNIGASAGLSDASPDWRVLAGLTTCQGVGTFNRPVPKLIDPEDLADEPEKPVKLTKIRLLTPLLSKRTIPDSPTSHLEIPVADPNKTLIINPSDRLSSPGIQPLGATAISPMVSSSKGGKTSLPSEPFPAKVRRLFRFPELTFSLNQWELSEAGRKSISLVAEALRKDNQFFIVSIEGHTDDVGSVNYNQVLSFKRAVAVATHLVLRDGFDPTRIFVKGHGESRPLENNDRAEGRALNRRVEFLILVPEGYEGVTMDIEDRDSKVYDSASLQQEPIIDPLAIEQAIMEKIGSDVKTPAGIFGRVDEAQ
jgi:outer membrane protein OmpA-like peptidoglycan-associated protein